MHIFLLFFLGAVLGSFVLVFVQRCMAGETIGGRSRCNACKLQLKAIDLVPVLSFVLLRGKCRHCKSSISYWHFFVEVILGLFFVSVFFITPEIGPQDVFIRLFLLSSLFVLFLFDAKHGVLPDLITLPTLLFTFMYMWFSGYDVPQMLGGAVIGSGVFALQYILSKGRWGGSGDIRLGAIMGVMLGVMGVLLALGIAYVAGAIIAVILLIAKRKKMADAIPFGIFLIPATVVVWYWGERILALLL